MCGCHVMEFMSYVSCDPLRMRRALLRMRLAVAPARDVGSLAALPPAWPPRTGSQVPPAASPPCNAARLRRRVGVPRSSTAAVSAAQRAHIAAASTDASAGGQSTDDSPASFVSAWQHAVRISGGAGASGASETAGAWWKERLQWRLWVRQLEAAALGVDLPLTPAWPDGEDDNPLDGSGATPASPATPAQGAVVLSWIAQQTQSNAVVTGAAAASAARSAAHSALVSAAIWSVHENTVAKRARWPLAFPATVRAAADALLSRPPADPDASSRVDLTSLPACVSIDNADTREVDDALSVEQLNATTIRVWVHIADPTRWLPLHMGGLDALDAHAAVLDASALRRGSSVYWPTGSVPMFPTLLATGPLSLNAGSRVAALSLAADVDVESGEVLAALATPSTICVTHAMTYDEADAHLLTADTSNNAGKDPLRLLATVASRRAAWRLARGATSIDMPQPLVSVTGATLHGGTSSARVSVSRTDPLPPGIGARNLVQECMLLAGDVAARLGAQSPGFPLPYRSQQNVSSNGVTGVQQQKQPAAGDEELTPHPDDIPPGYARSVARRLRLGPSALVFAPARHAALGLDAYVQVTSPIRRYIDLLAHAQLKALLRGANSPPFDGNALAQRAQAAAGAAAAAQRCSREGERYWIAVWFGQQPRGKTYSATFLRWLRRDLGLMSVLIHDAGLETAATCRREANGSSSAAVSRSPGEALILQCTAAKPHEGVLHFKEMSANAPSGGRRW